MTLERVRGAKTAHRRSSQFSSWHFSEAVAIPGFVRLETQIGHPTLSTHAQALHEIISFQVDATLHADEAGLPAAESAIAPAHWPCRNDSRHLVSETLPPFVRR